MTTSDDTTRGLLPGQYVPAVTRAVSDELAARASHLLGPTNLRISDVLPAELKVVRDWPDRIALLVGSDPAPEVLSALRRRGLRPVQSTVGTAIAGDPDDTDTLNAQAWGALFLHDIGRDDLA